MGQSPSREANRFAASQQIPHILWNLKVLYGIRKCPPPDPYLWPDRSSLCPHIPLPEDPS